MNVSVVIPVGPYPANKRWLDEAMESCINQTEEPYEIILVDDGAQLLDVDYLHGYQEYRQHPWNATYLKSNDDSYYEDIHVWPCPWRTGISHAFNYGVAIAQMDLVFMLGSDDTLEPTCLERCLEAYEKSNRVDGYYSVPIKYMDTQEVQTAPCNAAMVTKGFWRWSGGFPIETAIGIGDSTLLSICIKHQLPVYWVGEVVGDPDTPLYNYRRHPDIHTYKIPWGIAGQIRDHCTDTWTPEAIQEWSKGYA